MNISLLLLTYCYYLCYGAPMGNAVVTNTGVDAASLSYLLTNGYYTLSQSTQVGQIEANQEKIGSALKEFQRFAHIPITGKFDAATKDMMAKPRCGVPDKRNGISRRRRRYNHQGSKWEKTDLTWALENSNNDGITKNEVRSIMLRSFAKWESITNLKFIEVSGPKAQAVDIRVRFETGSHGDPFPFDGKGGTLAHAFFPLDNTGLAGDVHFDDDEIFTIKDDNENNKRKLLWIAVHELGHSIGLDHSDTKGAVMFPWYQHFSGNDFDLTEDDRLGIQTLYGSRVVPTQKTTSTLTPMVVQKSECTDRVGAVLFGKDKNTYVFNKNFYYLVHKESEGMGVKEGPKLVQSLFREISFVDAVFRRPDDDAIVIFHGDKFTVYDSTKRKNEARLISDGFHGLPVGISEVDASFAWSQNRKLYIFKGENYWRLSKIFNSDDFTLDRDYPKRIASNWQGLPASIDAVFQWNNGETYFFKDDVYYRWNTRHNRVQSGYPQKTSNTFLECTKGSFLLQRKQASSSVKNAPLLLVLLISLVAAMQLLL